MTYDKMVLIAGVGQLCVLVASALVPVHLDWKKELAPLPKLIRQMYWVYGGYVVLSIIALGVISIVNYEEIAGGGRLARSFCLFAAVFWGVRVGLTKWWLTAGYHTLTVMFLFFVGVFGWGVVR